MKKIEILWTNMLYNILVFLLILSPFGVSALVAVGSALFAGFLLGFVDMGKKPAFFMAVTREIWRQHIEEALYKDNTFLNHISDVDEDNIIGGKIVHIPQSGGAGSVQRNRTVKPATVRQRTDSEVLYVIDEYTSDPVHISNADTKELSYDKRESVLREDLDNLGQEVAEGMLENIIRSPVGNNATLPSANIIVTSGLAIAATSEGATGTRKAYQLGDLQKMRNFFRKQKAWKDGFMYALLTPDAETQMFPASDILTATYMASVTEDERRNGIMYKCQGWLLLSRSTVYTLDGAGAIKPYGSATAITDNEGILFWNKNFVEKAKGETTFFDDLGNPAWYGDIYSFLIRMGGRAKRKMFEGVAILRQVA